MKIIDADGHIEESNKDIKTFLPPPYNKRAGSLLPGLGLDCPPSYPISPAWRSFSAAKASP